MMLRFSALLLCVASPALAQQIQPDAVAPGTVQPAAPKPTAAAPAEDASGLTGTVSADGAWNNLGLAVPAFATDKDVPTETRIGGTAALGRAVAEVIVADLKNNGLFKPTGPDGLPVPGFAEVSAPDFAQWAGKAEMLVSGAVTAAASGIHFTCGLYDIGLKQQLVLTAWDLPATDWRRGAHKCADAVYARLSGESPFFDSRIAYIAETGPKDRRIKRLAVMDSDGENHRYLTTGLTMALTPRYSPDYKSILYLSYLGGNVRIYIYDLATNSQKLVVQSSNPTFAPRWSPDGKWVLYSMATAGTTNIYKVAAAGGPSQQLTNTPGISIGGSFSPDGSKVVFESDRSGSQQLYVMNADGSDQHRISFFGGRAATPEWSPRGDQIAFTHITGNFRVAVVDPNGGNLRSLTDSWQDEAPTWAPNGRIIQFFRTTRNSGQNSLWQVDLTGRNERKLPTPVDASDPAWGPIRP